MYHKTCNKAIKKDKITKQTTEKKTENNQGTIEKQEQVKIVEVWFKGHSTSNCEISGKVVGVCAVTLLCQIHYNSWNSANHLHISLK